MTTQGLFQKKQQVVDLEGTVLSTAGTLLPEAEYEWDGVTRPLPNGTMHTYSDGRDGMGEYRIPLTMQRIDL